MSPSRYAVYFVPATASPLWRFGCATLGYDAATGEDVAFAVPPGADPDGWPALTAEPRHYGFHATLKAPFELQSGRSEGQLRAFAHQLAAGLRPALLAGLEITALGSFVALTPSQPSAALQKLAFDIVQAFEPFRAPLSHADMERRLKSPLTPAHRAYLEAYGYPYVGEAFRFHMTLTGALPASSVAAAKDGLKRSYAETVPAASVAIDRLALFKQETRESRFRLIDSFLLG